MFFLFIPMLVMRIKQDHHTFADLHVLSLESMPTKWATLPDSAGFGHHPVYGFDSFRGIDEDWGTSRGSDLFMVLRLLGAGGFLSDSLAISPSCHCPCQPREPSAEFCVCLATVQSYPT